MIAIMIAGAVRWQYRDPFETGGTMFKHLSAAFLPALLAIAPMQAATAQDHGAMTGGHMPGMTMPGHSPYAGMERRAIKALSQQEIAELDAGRGMGLAMAAELNGYPGPAHVLELAAALDLSAEQQAKTKALFEAMKRETIPIGKRIIAEERALDRLFADKQATAAAIEAATARIATLRGELRAAHLRYHLAMAKLLSPSEIARYAELRGYAGASQAHAGR
jgi:Spy/CpxP family protein refolding chaperone